MVRSLLVLAAVASLAACAAPASSRRAPSSPSVQSGAHVQDLYMQNPRGSNNR